MSKNKCINCSSDFELTTCIDCGKAFVVLTEQEAEDCFDAIDFFHDLMKHLNDQKTSNKNVKLAEKLREKLLIAITRAKDLNK